MSKNYYVYIATNRSHTLYIGITNNPVRRMWEHKNKLIDGFTRKYNIDKLIYIEEYQDINQALAREKQIKSWSRRKKINLIKAANPKFEELII
ncbi:GIY-YIG nuclease family protein [Candidatus Gottesmanbacteria bacterium]|nr:GIY-YIG nuclease family protein [Candidatus Gottesmanbacteria bacterium]